MYFVILFAMSRPGCWDVLASAGQDHLLKVYNFSGLENQTRDSSQLKGER